MSDTQRRRADGRFGATPQPWGFRCSNSINSIVAGNDVVGPEKYVERMMSSEITAFAIIANGAVESAVRLDVELGLISVQHGQRQQGIEVNCENTIALKRQVLRKVGAAVVVFPEPPLKLTTATTWSMFAVRSCLRVDSRGRFCPFSSRYALKA